MRGSEPVVRRDSRLFEELCSALLSRGCAVRFLAHGESMQPNLLDGDDVLVAPAEAGSLRRADVVLAENTDGLRVHRLSSFDLTTGSVALRSDTGHDFDPPVHRVLGKVLSCRRGSEEQSLTPFQMRFVHPLRVQLRRLRVAAKLRLRRLAFLVCAIVSVLACTAFFAPAVHAQTADLQLTQTASASAIAAGSNVTYTDVVKNNTSSATVTAATITAYMQTPPNTVYESNTGQWSLGTATNATWAANVATYTFAAVPSSVVVGSLLTTTGFTPNGYNVTNSAITAVTATTVSVALAANPGAVTKEGTGTATVWSCTTPAVGGTGPVVCTYEPTLASGATASTLTVTFEVTAGVAAGTTIQSSATVTNSTFTDTVPSNNTSITSIVVEPTTSSDLAVSMSVSPTPVFVSSTFTYTILVQNLGQATAPVTANVLSDTLPTNVTFSSYTASAGWSCPTTPAVGSTGTVQCGITTAMTMGSTATITITVTAPTNAMTLNNTATVTLSGDPNSANNTATAYTVVQPIACATPGRDGAGGTLTGVVNAYYPPAATGTLASGSTSVTLGAAAGAPAAQTPISSGDLLLIIQMQGAIINASNTSSYGHGVPGDPGAGWTSLGSAGLFEFVTATNTTSVPVTGGTLTFTGTGPTGGLLNSYSYATATVSSLGTATTASWAANVATFTFPGPLPATVVPNSILTTTGFTPAGYNVTGATILTVNNTSGVVTVALTTNPGAETTPGTGSAASQGQETFQVIRVPQYTSATLSSTLTALPWNGSVGGVLALDVSSQLTLGGTVALDALGFRGAGGITLTGTTATVADTDYVTVSPANLPNLSGGDAPANSGTNASKGEGIAGTPHWVAPALSTITTSSTALSTGQSAIEGLPDGSFARGAPGNAGGGGTDGDPKNNDYNSGGGAGGNGGTGGQGGYGWNSMAATNTTDGGFGGVVFPASTSALVMGGGGGAGTVNNGSYYISATSNGADCGLTCTGIFSSGGYGGGIAIIHAGSVTGTGTITSNGQSTLSTLNDSTGGGGAGGSILVFANSGGLSTLTVNAIGGNGGDAWPNEAPGGFPGQRHGPGGGGGGGVIFLSATPAASNVSGGANGYTDTVDDSYGSTPGQSGVVVTTDIITETPGTQSGAYCGSADLSVTNSALPLIVLDGGTITYTQKVYNNGPLDAVNAVFSESIPQNTTFGSVTAPTGWTCNTPVTTTLTCTNPDFTVASSPVTFTVTVTVGASVPSGTQITDVDNVTSGTYDPNLANNSATATVTVGTATMADLAVTNTASAATVVVGATFTMTSLVSNNGPATVSGSVFTENTAVDSTNTYNATFVSVSAPAGWGCTTPSVGGTGTITCYPATLAAGASGTIVITETAPTAPAGTVISGTANINSGVPDPNYANNSATASIEIANAGQADLSVAASGTPNPVTAGNNITYTQTVTNNGPTAITTSASTTVTFTDVIPTNTTLVSYTTPTNWTCNTTTVGTTVTLTCTLNTGQTFNIGSSYPVNFPLVVKVNAGTAGGTVITNSPTIASTVSDPNTANNTATVTTIVASPTQSYVTITKSASPEPVNLNDNLAYTIVVTNNGPAVAQGVTVSDPIPTATVTYTSSTASQGSGCTYSAATTTVTCNLGSLGVGSSATITINVNAAVFGSGAVACNGSTTTYTTCNTATLTTTTSNPNPNTSSSVASTIQASTAVDLASFSAFQQTDGSVRLIWHTLEESRNLGFHIYREDATGQHRVDTSLIAGSALILRGSRPQHAAKWYTWVDAHPRPNASYWIQDVDINGTRTMHGPAYPEPAPSTETQPYGAPQSLRAFASSPSLSQLNSNAISANPGGRRPMIPIRFPNPPVPPTPPTGPSFNVADHAAVQISVSQEGWYHIPFAQLFSAGLNPYTDVRLLHLYAEGVEQPLLLIGHTAGYPAPSDAIEFYGTGIDTPFSGTRVYWLVTENSFSKRILPAPATVPAGSAGTSFPFTTILEERTTYFAALLNGENNDNFFGDIVTSEPVDELLTVTHLDTSSTQPLTLALTLQGVTDQQLHSVAVLFNGTSIGTFDFYGEVLATQSFTVDPSLVLDGTNDVNLTALEGDNDVSLVQSVQLTYPHTYMADSDWLRATAAAGSEVQISGFGNSAVRLFDISDPQNIVELNGTVSEQTGTYSISATVPMGAPATRTILAFAQDALSAPVSLVPYAPAFLENQRAGADIVIITHPDFASSLGSLVRLRTSQGYKVMQVTTDQLFNQFNYGERSPFAIRTFLQEAVTQWQRQPKAILLVGDASMDPRDYLGFGDFDFVPTRIIETAAFKTASDDWFTDFQQTGYPTIPTGRLPVRTVSDLDLVISKIVGYEQGQSAGSWNNQALLIADQNVEANFSAATTTMAATLPSFLQTSEILTDGMDPSTAHSQIVQALNSGALIVDYNGHGAEQQWSFSDIFDDNDAGALTNGGRLPVYLLMDCLNGLFQDVYAESLAKSLILAPNGGAVAVWASSGFTGQSPQAAMELALLNELAAHPSEMLGLMVLRAKSVTTDNDVRRTWIWFGDPAMKLHFGASTSSSGLRTPPNPSGPINPTRGCPRGVACTLEKQQ